MPFLIRLDRIVPDPDQPRKVASIRERGVKQPLTVRWMPELERYMVVDGGRRFAAAKHAGVESLPCWVQRVEGREVLLVQIIHNWQRVNLRPFETADALARLRDEHGLSQQELVKMTGKPKGEISKLLALHDKVVPEVQQMAREDQKPVDFRQFGRPRLVHAARRGIASECRQSPRKAIAMASCRNIAATVDVRPA